tara:strand:+ start:90563 stop:91627 length:1065 start_codon:yes stop_codon:yes gene_type:complete
MKRFAKALLLPVTGILALLLVVGWMAGMFSDKLKPGSTSQAAAPVKSGDVIIARQREQPQFESVPASVEAKQATVISSRILARIERIHVRAGDTVEQGQVLVDLENTDLESRVSQATASVASVSARLTEARQALSRARELTAKGLLAQADLDQAQANHDALVAQLNSARQVLGEASTAMSYARITAPISGRIVDRFAEPGDTAQPGTKLLSLYNPLSLRVEANVREQLALTLQPQQSLLVTIPALDKTLTSTIEERVPAGDVGSRSFLVKSRLQDSQGLLPGMYAQLHIPAGTESVVVIPAGRIASVGQVDVVWVLENKHVARRFVRTGKHYDDGTVEILSGIVAGDQILPSRQ